MSSRISFEIRKKATDKRVTCIEAPNFKSAIREFAQTYDLPSVNFRKSCALAETFVAINDSVEVEFNYIDSADMTGHVEYKIKKKTGKIELTKKGIKTWPGYFD